MIPSLVVHGGAGAIDSTLWSASEVGCRQAVEVGLTLLEQGASALDAVQAAVRVLEEDPTFNAGTGAALTRNATVELDAALMEGTGLRFGAIAAVPSLLNPIDLARAVLDDGEHTLLVGEAAWEFATPLGFQRDTTGRMIVELQRRALLREQTNRAARAAAPIVGGGTVGACAIDTQGHVAAATSTGGITFKRRGRVGDAPLPGCGTYAEDRGGAASATGHGESIMRVTLTRFVIDRLIAGADATTAAQLGIAELTTRVGGSGGVIVVDREGRIGLAHNTPEMAWGSGSAFGERRVGIRVD